MQTSGMMIGGGNVATAVAYGSRPVGGQDVPAPERPVLSATLDDAHAEVGEIVAIMAEISAFANRLGAEPSPPVPVQDVGIAPPQNVAEEARLLNHRLRDARVDLRRLAARLQSVA